MRRNAGPSKRSRAVSDSGVLAILAALETCCRLRAMPQLRWVAEIATSKISHES